MNEVGCGSQDEIGFTAVHSVHECHQTIHTPSDNVEIIQMDTPQAETTDEDGSLCRYCLVCELLETVCQYMFRVFIFIFCAFKLK